MSYVGYYQDSKNGILRVSERINGKRICEDFPLILEYYIPDENGYYEGYDGKRLKKITFKNTYAVKNIKEDCAQKGIKTYELNFNLPNKVLYQQFNGQEAPDLHKSFLDIEVDRKDYEYLTVKELVDQACCPINAISIYNDWQESLYTLMLCPENIPYNEAQNICNNFDKTFLFKDEAQLLDGIISLLDDADCISSWNGSRFDYPYIVRRLENVLGKGQSARLNVWNIPPKEKMKKDDFGYENLEYEFYGKWFSDYLELYKKHEQGKKESYKLDAIAELELGENKIEHDESLDDMYRQRYEDFIKYNRQDTMLVKKLDDKKKFIAQHNQQAHECCCSLEQTTGTVGWVCQAIINEAHNKNLIVPDKQEGENSEFKGIIPPGAYCADPINKGLVSGIFSMDLASLYPNTSILLNLSPETLVAQVEFTLTLPYLWKKIEENDLWKNKSRREPDWGAAWGGIWSTLEYEEIMKQSDVELILKINETKEEIKMTAKQIYELVFSDDSNLCISASGTLFRTDKQGLYSGILTKWYADRKSIKKEMFRQEAMETGVQVLDENLLKELQQVLNNE